MNFIRRNARQLALTLVIVWGILLLFFPKTMLILLALDLLSTFSFIIYKSYINRNRPQRHYF